MVFFGKLSKYYMYIMTTGRNPAVSGKPQSQQELRPRNTQETLSQDSGIYNTVSSRNTNLSQETGIYNTVSPRYTNLSQETGIYNTVSSINAQVPLSQESGIYTTLSSNTYQHNYTSLSGNPPVQRFIPDTDRKCTA